MKGLILAAALSAVDWHAIDRALVLARQRTDLELAAKREAATSPDKGPGLIVLCESGGVAPNESHLGSGYHCVLHDKNGSVASAGAISIYDDSMAVP